MSASGQAPREKVAAREVNLGSIRRPAGDSTRTDPAVPPPTIYTPAAARPLADSSPSPHPPVEHHESFRPPQT